MGAVAERRYRIASTYIWAHGLVDGTPPDVILGSGLLDDALVEGRTAGLGTRVCREGTAGSDRGTGFVDEGVFVEGGDGGVGNLCEG